MLEHLQMQQSSWSITIASLLEKGRYFFMKEFHMGVAQNNLGIQSWPVNGSSEFKNRECKNDFELINLLWTYHQFAQQKVSIFHF